MGPGRRVSQITIGTLYSKRLLTSICLSKTGSNCYLLTAIRGLGDNRLLGRRSFRLASDTAFCQLSAR